MPQLIFSLGGIIGIAGVLIILATYFIFHWKYLSPLARTIRSLESAQNRLLDEQADSAECFSEEAHHLHELWHGFLDARAGTTVTVDGVEVSTLDIEEVFTEHAVLEGYNRNMAVAVAGVLTGLGILGTFVGLIIGMAGLGAEISEMVENVGQLLSGMWAAFLTSVVGISFSLIWLGLDRRRLHRVQRAANRFFTAVRKRYPVESTDRLLHRLLAEEQEGKNASQQSRDLLEEQTGILQSLSFDLASRFAEALDTSLTERLTPALEAMTETMQSLSVQIGDRQTEAMRQMVDTFQERLSDELGGHFEGLAQALERTAQWQERVHTDLGDLIERVQEASENQLEVIQQSRDACEVFSLSLDQLGTAHGRIADASNDLGELSERVKTDVSALVGDLSERMNQVTTALTSALEASAQHITSAAETLEGRVDALDRQQEVYREANEAIRTELARQIDAIDEQVQALTGFWSNFRKDLEQVGDGLKESVSTFSSVTEDKLREIFANFDAEMAKVVEHLSGTLAEVREVTEELPAGTRQLHDTLTGAVKPIAEAASAVRDLAEPLRTLEALPPAVAELAPLDGTVRHASERIASAESAMTALTDRMATIEQALEHLNARPEHANADAAQEVVTGEAAADEAVHSVAESR